MILSLPMAIDASLPGAHLGRACIAPQQPSHAPKRNCGGFRYSGTVGHARVAMMLQNSSGESRVLDGIFGYCVQVRRGATHSASAVHYLLASLCAGDGPLFGAESWVHSPPSATQVHEKEDGRARMIHTLRSSGYVLHAVE